MMPLESRQRLNRVELHQRIWNEPKSKVARSLNITDAVLRKICCDFLIPMPDQEYWKKKRNGHSVRITALPWWPGELEPEVVLVVPKDAFSLGDEIDADIAELVIFEREHPIAVPEQLLSPHPMVRATKQAMKAPFRGMYDRLMPTRSAGEVLHLEVYQSSIKRVLLLLDTLLKAPRSRGHDTQFRHSPQVPKCVSEVRMLDNDFHFVIRERFQRAQKSDADPWPASMADYEYRPTSDLKLLVYRGDGWGPIFTVMDGKKRLEERLNYVIIRMLAEVQEARQRAIRRRLRELEREEQDRERRQREEVKRAEEARERQLLEAATAWAQVMQLRQYLDALRSEVARRGRDAELDDDMSAWFDWAEDYTGRISPIGKDKPLPVFSVTFAKTVN